jgi:hypothetical protein
MSEKDKLNCIDAKVARTLRTAKSYFIYSEAEFRELLQKRYGVSFIDNLTNEQGEDLLNYFRSIGFGKPHKKWTCTFCASRPLVANSHQSVARGATPAQLSVVNILKDAVVWNQSQGFEKWLLKRFGLKEIKHGQDASVIIMALKGIIRVQKKRCAGCKWLSDVQLDGLVRLDG